MQSRIISFDIGIRNMAYCIFDISASTITIPEWTVINVGELPSANTKLQSHKCTCMTKSSSICNRAAKYIDPNETKYYCMTHAKTSEYLIPKKTYELANLKKRKIADLYNFLTPFMNTYTEKKQTSQIVFTKKQDALDFAKIYFETHSLKHIVQSANRNMKEIDLLTIGRNIKTLFDQSPHMAQATHVIIENQISPLANRMKTIQGMVAQYFIMKNSNIVIEFISSSNKLKGLVSPKVKQVISTPAKPAFVPPPSNVFISEPFADPPLISANDNQVKKDAQKDAYKQHKKDAVNICRQFIQTNPCMTVGNVGGDMLSSSKKDDLSDCFLQGIWYLKSQNIITYAENLKINSI